MKKCIVYGAGRHAAYLVDILRKDKFTVFALCDSDSKKVGTQYLDLDIISKDEAIKLCRDDDAIRVVIGVNSHEARREILGIINSEFPDKTQAITDIEDIRDRVERTELEQFYNKMVFRWKVDLLEAFRIWLSNLDSEINFWLEYGLDRNAESAPFLKQSRRTNRRELLFEEPDLAGVVKDGDVVMDIGCALMTGFGEKIPDGFINLIPVDPLAYYYNLMNARDELAIERTYYCYFGMFELISNLFGENYAKCMYISNSMDHSFDPYRGLIKCLYTVKVNGIIKLRHRKAEAVHENWSGLHKWNFDCIKGDFIIWNKENAINISEELKEIAEIKVYCSDSTKRSDQYVTVLMKKKKRFELSDFIDIEEENNLIGQIVSMLFERMALDGKDFQEKLSKVMI